ncbi:MAG: T9SS C-terminal target domain-containing protein [Chitinophagaceae bacterium]|nr:T9SS C-terminal target domain-containing protein [Chitinophagaceae bacterium]
MRLLFSLLFIISMQPVTRAQEGFPFQIQLDPVIIPSFAGLQSYAWAKSGELILLIGGRTDGLHKKQPFAAFNKNDNNKWLIVLDPEKEKVWKRSLDGLPPGITQQLQSTNMEYYQDGNELILAGGYGYSELAKDHITHPYLIRIQVKELIRAIIDEKDPAAFVSQIKDERMAVTGGRMQKLGDAYYLAGGHRFDGRYNPDGPDHGPGFSQQYTNQVRKFRLSATGFPLSITSYSAITDTTLFHRRDYNLLPQYDEAGKKMLTIFSGVFRPDKDLPFTNLTDIKGSSYQEVKGFNQQFSHYHAACVPVYDAKNKTGWSVFFGGIAVQYADSTGNIQSDQNVPFAKHISVIERKEGRLKEYLLPEKFSGYFGAAAEFIPATGNLYNEDGFFLANVSGRNKKLAGYIIGGIDSRAPNVFWGNAPDGSRASPVVWKVYFSKT